MLEENLKRAFIIHHAQYTEILFSNMEGDSKYEAIESDQVLLEF